jgi:TonB family protein
MFAGALAAVLMQAAAPVAPPPLDPSIRPSVITSPDWLRRPSGEDFARLYPLRAMREEVEGRVTLACSVSERGTLTECSVTAEDPVGYEFGAAALTMSKLFLMRPQTKDGQAVAGGTVRIPLRFVLPKGPATPVPTLEVASRCYTAAATSYEAKPTDDTVRLGFFAWRMMIEMKLAGLRLPPSEVDRRLQALRGAGAPRPTDVDRTTCEAIANPGAMQSLNQMLAGVADKP